MRIRKSKTKWVKVNLLKFGTSAKPYVLGIVLIQANRPTIRGQPLCSSYALAKLFLSNYSAISTDVVLPLWKRVSAHIKAYTKTFGSRDWWTLGMVDTENGGHWEWRTVTTRGTGTNEGAKNKPAKSVHVLTLLLKCSRLVWLVWMKIKVWQTS